MRKRKEKYLRPVIEQFSLAVVEQTCSRVQK